jgi:hypothetical protein
MKDWWDPINSISKNCAIYCRGKQEGAVRESRFRYGSWNTICWNLRFMNFALWWRSSCLSFRKIIHFWAKSHFKWRRMLKKWWKNWKTGINLMNSNTFNGTSSNFSSNRWQNWENTSPLTKQWKVSPSHKANFAKIRSKISSNPQAKFKAPFSSHESLW